MAESAIVICSSCGTKNRIPVDRITQGPVCGRCKSSLNIKSIYTEPVTITDQTFEKEVLAHGGIVLMDFWASWCGHCKSMDIVLASIALDYAGRIKVVKLNVDENPATASKFKIMSLPSLLFFRKGKVVDSTVGVMSRQEIDKRLKSLL